MAVKKKVAKKTATSKPAIVQDIPEGFTIPAGAQVPNWDYEKQGVLIGDVVSIRTITKKKPRKGEAPTTRLATIREQATGKLLQVWESGALHAFFDEVVQGGDVFIRFDGLGEKVKGRMQMKMFTSAYNNHGKKATPPKAEKAAKKTATKKAPAKKVKRK